MPADHEAYMRMALDEAEKAGAEKARSILYRPPADSRTHICRTKV